jgi:hypothetical protein
MSLILSGSDGLSDIDGTAATPAIRGTDTNTGIFFPAADTIAFSEGGAESMRLDSAGNLGIGTTTMNGKVNATAKSTFNPDTATWTETAFNCQGGFGGGLSMLDGSAGYVMSVRSSGGVFTIAQGTAGSAPAERMRITSGGDLLIGTTSANYGKLQAVAGGSGGAALFQNGSTNDLVQIYGNQGGSSGTGMYAIPMFFGNTTLRGGISWSGTNVQYNTTSDYRLKENIAPMTGALAKISQLKPVTFTWKESNTPDQGFIAHELQEIFSGAVTGEKDAVNEDGSIKAQGIDTSFLVATLTAAIQELKATVDAQAARIAALENPPVES